MKRIIAIYLLFSLCFFNIFSQTSTTTVNVAPYTKDEFSTWMRDLRRFEIISLGAVPFMTLTANLVYGLYKLFDTGEFVTPFQSGKTSTVPENEQLYIFISGMSAGLLVGIIDFIIVQVKRADEQKKYARSQRDGSIIVIEPLQSEEIIINDTQENFTEENDTDKHVVMENN